MSTTVDIFSVVVDEYSLRASEKMIQGVPEINDGTYLCIIQDQDTIYPFTHTTKKESRNETTNQKEKEK